MLSRNICSALKAKISQAILDVEYDLGPIHERDMNEVIFLCSSVVQNTVREIKENRTDNE